MRVHQLGDQWALVSASEHRTGGRQVKSTQTPEEAEKGLRGRLSKSSVRPLYFVADMGLVVGCRVGSAQHRGRIQVSVAPSTICPRFQSSIPKSQDRAQDPSSHPEPKTSDSPGPKAHSPQPTIICVRQFGFDSQGLWQSSSQFPQSG